jgi:hypothetical protein
MPKVKTETDAVHDGKGGRYPIGTIIEVSDKQARSLIENGHASGVADEAPPAKARAKPKAIDGGGDGP